MKKVLIVLVVGCAALLAGCEAQSGIASKSVEKYVNTPTPQPTASPEPPIDPADVVNVDTKQEGPKLVVKKITDNTALNCDKYNRVAINVDDKSFVIKGVCSELMVNGDRNQVVLEAASVVVLNGNANNVRYSKFPNGKRPFIKDNGGANSVEKTAAQPIATKR